MYHISQVHVPHQPGLCTASVRSMYHINQAYVPHQSGPCTTSTRPMYHISQVHVPHQTGLCTTSAPESYQPLYHISKCTTSVNMLITNPAVGPGPVPGPRPFSPAKKSACRLFVSEKVRQSVMWKCHFRGRAVSFRGVYTIGLSGLPRPKQHGL